MTEAEAIAEVVAHINSGKKLIFGHICERPLPIGQIVPSFWWCSVTIMHPTSVVRHSTLGEYLKNLPSWVNEDYNWHRDGRAHFYECSID